MVRGFRVLHAPSSQIRTRKNRGSRFYRRYNHQRRVSIIAVLTLPTREDN